MGRPKTARKKKIGRDKGPLTPPVFSRRLPLFNEPNLTSSAARYSLVYLRDPLQHIVYSDFTARDVFVGNHRRESSTLERTMKVFSNSCSFNYSWDEVSTANWRKYCPWNDKSTHVIAVDTLSRHVDPESGIVCLCRVRVRTSMPKYILTVL